MAKKITFSIKNVWLALLALLFICLFTSLGVWQWSRAAQKKILLQTFTQRTLHTLHAEELDPKQDQRFYRVRLTGHFDQQHHFLLDNKIFHGQVGYEVYTPFYAKGFNLPILIDRGFIPNRTPRSQLPAIRNIPGEVTISGMLNLPPSYVAWGNITESPQITWPLRVEFIHLTTFTKWLRMPFFPYLLTLEPHHPLAYATEWQIVAIGPERHQGYAVQWFALALTLLILFVVLNCRRR